MGADDYAIALENAKNTRHAQIKYAFRDYEEIISQQRHLLKSKHMEKYKHYCVHCIGIHFSRW